MDRRPAPPGDLAHHLPAGATARVGLDLMAAPVRARRGRRGPPADVGKSPGSPPRTFMDVALARVGPTVAQGFYAPYAAKIWGVPADELAAEVAARRVGISTPGALLCRVLRSRRSTARTFLYPRLGFSQVSSALARAAVEAGARLWCGADVVGVSAGPAPRFVGVTCRDGRVLRATTVFSTLPAGTLCALTDPVPPVQKRVSRCHHL